MKSNRRIWLQFGIGTLLFFMFCTAGFLTGYRRGFNAGHEAKSQTRAYAKVYYIKDIIAASEASGGSGTALIAYLKATVIPQSWSTKGGPGEIAWYAANDSIVVSNIQDVHDQLADTLQQIRLMQQQGKAKDVDSVLLSAGT
jgi:hypothetical protein